MEVETPTALRIFVSYRRTDSEGYSGRLNDHLETRYGTENVFFDGRITPGADFAKAIETAVSECDALLAVIGPEWLLATDDQGRRRLEDEDDWVRLEIAAALKREIPVVPVLVGGASMPSAAQLPDALRGLAARQAVELRHATFREDVQRLVDGVDREIAKRRAQLAKEAADAEARELALRAGPETPKRSWKLWSALAAIASASLVLAVVFWPRSDTPVSGDRDAASSATTSTVVKNWPVQLEMRAHFVDVGQAQATVLEFPCGLAVIDAGAEDDANVQSLVDYLHALFKVRDDLSNTIDLLVLSHPHIDHVRAASEVMQHFAVRTVFDNGADVSSGGAEQRVVRERVIASGGPNVYRAIKLADLPIRPVFKCNQVDVAMTILWGGLDSSATFSEQDRQNQNNHSIVVRVDFGESSLLLPGDLEEPALEALLAKYKGTEILDTDVLLVAHHGSNRGTTKPFLDAVTPDIAIISVGKYDAEDAGPFSKTAYGHPRRQTIELLSAATKARATESVMQRVATGSGKFEWFELKSQIYSTAWSGTIILTLPANGPVRVDRG